MLEPDGGNVDPSGVTHAYAKGARNRGADVIEHNRVVELNQRPDHSWDVVTEKGTIHAQVVVGGSPVSRWAAGHGDPERFAESDVRRRVDALCAGVERVSRFNCSRRQSGTCHGRKK